MVTSYLRLNLLLKNKMAKKKLHPYTCPSCGYITERKGNMYTHLYKSKSQCPKVANDIDLTDEIKEYILINRIMQIPDPRRLFQNKILCERFYQQVLEKHFKASHKKLKSGVTDITTSDSHIEIKEWESWIHAIGQLYVYNLDEPKEKLMVVLFGKYSNKCKKNAFDAFESMNVEVYDCVNELYQVKIINFKTKEVFLIIPL